MVASATPPTPVRVTPETLPSHILVEISPHGCTGKPGLGYVGIWYATVKSKIADIELETTSIRVVLHDAESDMFLFNPGTTHQVENGYLLHSIAFNEQILDQVVFEFRELTKGTYLIYLRDFYLGESC